MGIWRLAERPKTAVALTDSEKVAHVAEAEKCNAKARLLQLPAEIVQQILSYVPPQSLFSLSLTCRQLLNHAENELLWADLICKTSQKGLPYRPLPCDIIPGTVCHASSLLVSPRNKIWFSDDPHTGKIMLAKFDRRRGCIEGYRLLAERGPHHFQHWSHNPAVIIHSFVPRVHVWLDDPILTLNYDPSTPAFSTKQGWWEGEIRMRVGRPGHNTSASFFLSRNIPERLQDKSMDLWPPRTIPNMPRVRAASQDKFHGHGHKPQKYDEISQTTFRMRQWSQFSVEARYFGVRLGETVNTWSTIDPVLYTPTKDRPYQGIFVGDYAGHGCEFMLITQTDAAPIVPEQPEVSEFYQVLTPAASRGLAEIDASAQAQIAARDATKDSGSVFRGAIEAIKLTGDPNVPRGEHTFIADDIGPKGFIRIAEEAPFHGARVVRSRGHVAARVSRMTDEFVPSQLFLMSHDQVAQYWVPFGHISFYRRVDIKRILDDLWETDTEATTC